VVVVVVEVVTVTAVEVVGVEVRAAKARVGGRRRAGASCSASSSAVSKKATHAHDETGPVWYVGVKTPETTVAQAQRSANRNSRRLVVWRGLNSSRSGGEKGDGGTKAMRECKGEERAAKKNNKSKPKAVHVRLLGLRVR
jgi:hypothetical protein